MAEGQGFKVTKVKGQDHMSKSKVVGQNQRVKVAGGAIRWCFHQVILPTTRTHVEGYHCSINEILFECLLHNP